MLGRNPSGIFHFIIYAKIPLTILTEFNFAFLLFNVICISLEPHLDKCWDRSYFYNCFLHWRKGA